MGKQYVDFAHHLPTQILLLLLVGLTLTLTPLFWPALWQKKRLLYGFLLTGLVLFSSGFACIDPFLNLWDEQYHALVAKNLSENPLKPVLIKNSPLPPYLIQIGH